MLIRTRRTGLAVTLTTLLVGSWAPTALALVQTGVVTNVVEPIPLAKVTLYVAGETPGSGALELGSSFTNSDGSFSISYPTPPNPDPVLYLIAEGPDDGVRLATVLGTTPFPDDVTINERTTVATAYAMAQFINGVEIGGNTPGVQNAASMLRNLVDLRSGDVGEVLASRPNGDQTNTMALFNSLANLVASCARHQACDDLFELTTPPGGTPPENTLDAMINLAHYPWNNATELFTIMPEIEIYEPTLTLPPVTWTIALHFEGNGHMFNGPGNIAFDAQGNVWVNNNYVFRKNPNAKTCGGKEYFKLLPNGANATDSPFNGRRAGVDGAGYGICFDLDGNLWIGNFGFFGSTCPCKLAPPANSVSKVSPEGDILCPSTGFTQGCIDGPQATVCAPDGAIWIANACGGTVTRYNHANPNDFWVFNLATMSLVPPGSGCPTWQGDKPFGICMDADSNAWVTDNGTSVSIKLSPEGELLAFADSSVGIDRPLGNASDSTGGVWISNSHVVPVPCTTCSNSSDDGQTYGDLDAGVLDPSITHLAEDGSLIGTYRGGGLWIPWGIATDAAGNVWVANFGGKRLSAFTPDGDPIAPLGYYSDAMERITGVAIDASGNVWLCNNFKIVPPPTNPGGDGMLVFLGLGAPTKMPMFGPPQAP